MPSREPEVTSRIMSRVRHKDSKAEVALRRALFAAGLRYRLHAPAVLGRPDISVRGRKIAIFVDGDMWHGNPRLPQMRGRPNFASIFPSRTDWWLAKIARTRARDQDVTRTLQEDDWLVIRVWESDIIADANVAAAAVMEQIENSGQ